MNDQNGLQNTANAFIPLQLTSQIDEAFPLGEILISAAIADGFHPALVPALVQACLRRHASEDWGEVNPDVRITNWLTLRGELSLPIVSPNIASVTAPCRSSPRPTAR